MNDKLHFTDEGKGFPIVFIHGFCETHEMWSEFKEPFLNQYRVITVDLPGFGESTLNQKLFSLADIALEITALLKRLNVKACAVVAHSLGGYVTLEMMKANTSLFNGIVLFHSSAFADDEEKKDSRNKTIEFVEKRGVEVFATSFVPSLFYIKNRKNLTIEIEKAVKIASKTPLKTLVEYTKAMRDRNDNTTILKTFENPMMYIAGDKDTSVPIEKTMEQVDLPQKPTVHILRNTGHMGMFERQQETQEMLRDFLAKL